MDKAFRILITGDFCPVNRISDLILQEKYPVIFNNFLPVIKECDLAITNLECPLTDSDSKINKTGPLLKAPTDTVKALSFAGFNLVTLANNHIMDYGIKGLESTLQALESKGINHVGAGENYLKARNIYYRKMGNHTIAILNFAENEFSTTHGSYPGANPIDLIENYRDIAEAKTKAEYVIVIVHGGHEMYDLPSPRIRNTFHFYAEAGASAVFEHHSHCYSGYEVYKNTPVFYGLGNFIFDLPGKRSSIWNTGFAVELTLKDSMTFRIIPYEQCNESIGVKLLTDQAREEFDNNLKDLISIISDDKLLNEEFENYCKHVRKMYFGFLEPHSVRLLHLLHNRKLFPSLLSKKKKALYLNLMRCESHRDLLINLLDTR